MGIRALLRHIRSLLTLASLRYACVSRSLLLLNRSLLTRVHLLLILARAPTFLSLISQGRQNTPSSKRGPRKRARRVRTRLLGPASLPLPRTSTRLVVSSEISCSAPRAFDPQGFGPYTPRHPRWQVGIIARGREPLYEITTPLLAGRRACWQVGCGRDQVRARGRVAGWQRCLGHSRASSFSAAISPP